MSARTLGAGGLAAALAMTGGLSLTGATAAFAAAPVLARYEMNEPAGARVMHDSSGHGRDGRVGTEVRTGVALGGANKGYRFPVLPPKTPPTHPQHLVQVPDSAAIDPGTRDYAVTMRFRTTSDAGNLIQKGQSGSATGFFKLEIHQHLLSCLFRGVDGSTSVKTVTPVDDGAWHTVRCARTVDSLVMTVDSSIRRTGRGPTGSITNSLPLTIGGKLNCNEVTITCDYFGGDIDFVQLGG